MMGRSSRTIATSAMVLLVFASNAWGQKAPSMQRCLQLIEQFDRYYPRNGETLGSTGSRLDRGVGEIQCRRGEYADGIRTLEAAMRRNLISIPPE